MKRLLNKELIDDVSLLKRNCASIDSSTSAHSLPKEMNMSSLGMSSLFPLVDIARQLFSRGLFV